MSSNDNVCSVWNELVEDGASNDVAIRVNKNKFSSQQAQSFRQATGKQSVRICRSQNSNEISDSYGSKYQNRNSENAQRKIVKIPFANDKKYSYNNHNNYQSSAKHKTAGIKMCNKQESSTARDSLLKLAQSERSQKVSTGSSNMKKNNESVSNIKPMPFIKLQKIIKMEPNEIILTIADDKSFIKRIEQSDKKIDCMSCILTVLGKVCLADLQRHTFSVISSVSSVTNFLLVDIPKYLVSLERLGTDYIHAESVFFLVTFLQKFQQIMPSTSTESISVLLPILKCVLETYLKVFNETLHEKVVDILQDISEQNKQILTQYSSSDVKSESNDEKLKVLQPPENYRSLTILPTADDINLPCTFLRPNIVKGRYLDAEHYLDVQFRLLREDYIKPLRDGISEYLRVKASNKSLKSCKDVRIYSGVSIIKQDFIHGSMVHLLKFSENFSKINWEYNKRFLSGSLLCLSVNNFETMMFASVVQRNPDKLKEGLLLVRFENISDEVLGITPLMLFTVVETTAYFEAYRHNLKALHELDGNKLAFKRYIIDVEKTVLQPQYLNGNPSYDMRPLLIPLDKKFILLGDKSETFSTKYLYPSGISDSIKSVKILNSNSWPSASDMNLDESQYRALKAAVTKEFCIIQGPPGTGKTYIGLRIVQLLLHNIDVWHHERNRLPILVVCYTNHALDQFLEGLSLFTRKIARIGGRSSNELVSEFQIGYLKKLAREKKEICKPLAVSFYHKRLDLEYLQTEISKIQKNLEKTGTVVLDETKLMKHMPGHHYSSLISFNPSSRSSYGYNRMCNWLGIGKPVKTVVRLLKPDPELQKITVPELNVDSEDENDVEHIEAQRNIDTNDYSSIYLTSGTENTYEEMEFDEESEWQVQGGKKTLAKMIKQRLKFSTVMKRSEALAIKNVRDIDNIDDRWRLYKFWLQTYIESEQQNCYAFQQELKGKYLEMQELCDEEDLFILRNSEIVGMTTTGAAKYRHIILRLKPQILIVEEAAEILESHIVTSLAAETQHVILIGDHQQLQPSPTVHMLATKYKLSISLFERMVKNDMDCYKLNIQHRMRPDIKDLISPHIYETLENHQTVLQYENIKGVNKNVYFISHGYNELPESDSKSKVNEHEAKFLLKLCRYLILQGYDPSQITVLTTYSGQLFKMKKLKIPMLQNVRFTVVDNFQGEENDIILISFVRSNEDGIIGFLKVPNRVCVALSRARKALYCIGNFDLLAEKSELWNDIINTLQQKKAIGPALQLSCQNHPEMHNNVSNEKDFDSVPEGGCKKPCEYRLSCGHVCSLMCHPYDKSHEEYNCIKKCSKTCEEGHPCKKKCFEKCGKCMHLVPKKIVECGHTISVPCCKQKEKNNCISPCERILKCGHKCKKLCFESCSVKCLEKEEIELPCGHKHNTECYLRENILELLKICNRPCKAYLTCGHICQGTCSKCYHGRLHMLCNEPCKRILICGHECSSPCSKSCPPCQKPCENRCVHSRCPKTCGEPCQICAESCKWFCTHRKCKLTCGEICNRAECHEPCPKLLSCNHPCIGFCGEPCPKDCRICDPGKVQDIFFGSEDEINTRFVLLQDCNHYFEVDGLNRWMHTGKEDGQIQMKSCPKCKTVIRTNLRYGNIVKKCLSKIEKVKQKTYGSKENNLSMQKRILRQADNLSYLEVAQPLIKVLSSDKVRNFQQLATIENIINIVKDLTSSTEYDLFQMRTEIYDDAVMKLFNYFRFSLEWVSEFIQDEYLTASEQQMRQIGWEAHRLKLIAKLLNLSKNRKNSISCPDFETCSGILTKYTQFNDEDLRSFSNKYKCLCSKIGSAVINVSELEKKSILTAMGLSLGHWYQCPNGHVYCITECGGAMQEGVCNECKERIGGRNHALLQSNRVASDMDGSRHGAWSDAMNMNNYRL